MSETMSLTKALLEIKLTDKKIDKKINAAHFIDFCQEKQVDNGALLTHRPRVKFEDEAKADFQSINDLFDRRGKIKAALSKKNAETMLTIGTKSYSIASAIELKKSISKKLNFLSALKNQYANVKNQLEQHNTKILTEAHKGAIATLGDNVDTSGEKYKSMRQSIIDANKLNIIDPLGLKAKIDELENEIDEFQSHVDCLISQTNSLTEIEI